MMPKPSPPPPPGHPLIHHFVMLGSAEPRLRELTNFRRHITIWRVLGSAKPRIPWDAN